MLIVITDENYLENEGVIINELFLNGLSILHLRKMTGSKAEFESLLNQINSRFHKQIMIHQFHDLARKYDLKGIHLTEKHRNSLKEDNHSLSELLGSDTQIMSTSFHDIKSLETDSYPFQYQFLSPVFSSISKSGYTGKKFNVKSIQKRVIALGGIQTHNLEEAAKLGFDGFAVLGHIWKSTDPVNQFITLQTKYQSLL